MLVYDPVNNCGEEVSKGTEFTPNVFAGDIIRGESFTTLYAVSENGTRRPFFNESIFFTHYDTFNEVKVVPDIDLQSLELDVPVLPKAETVLVKISSNPKVFWSVPNPNDAIRPLLRWITTEEIAIEMFGDDWADFVLDIDPTMWQHFDFGDDIIEAEEVAAFTERRALMKKRIDLADPDSDGDGLVNSVETTWGTNPANPDTDGDGFLDGEEVEHGFNPLGPGLMPPTASGFTFSRFLLSGIDLMARSVLKIFTK